MHDRPPVPLIELLPQHLRNRDAEEGRALEALMGLLGEELAIVERDLDQLYDNWFIESCEPWVIPYIGALIGARPMRSFGAGEVGLRSYVANTLGYRQAKGTAAAIEQIARDVTGWPVVAVEFFQRLIWSQHVNHVRPGALGTASIRDAEAARLSAGAFSDACHSAAAGPVDTASGRYAIPHVGLFVWRLDAYPLGFLSNEAAGYVGGLVPRISAIGPGFRHFDPLGADRALFNQPKADRSIAGRVDMRMVPAPLDRRLLHRDLNRLREGAPGGGRWFDEVPVLRVRLAGAEVPPERLHSCNLATRTVGGNPTWRRPQQAGHILFDPELGRLALHASDEGKAVEASCAFAAPFALGGGSYDRTASFAAWRDTLLVDGAPAPWVIGVSARAEEQTDDILQGGVVVASLAEAILRWNAGAATGTRGLIVMLDNASYAEDLSDAAHILRIPAEARLAIVAAAWPAVERAGGVIARESSALSLAHRRAHIRGDLRVRAIQPGAEEEAGSLILDGLLIEGEVAIMAGALGNLALYHCTIGASAAGLSKGVRVISANGGLAVTVDHSITGPLALGTAGGGLVIRDSIVGEDRDLQADPDLLPLVIDAPVADVDISRSTIFGRASIRSIEAENSLLVGTTRAAQRQRGCVRFCYAPLTSRVPRRYRCQPDLAIAEAEQAIAPAPLPDPERQRIARSMAPIFTASAFPASAFGQLALACPGAVAAGAFGGAEMGAGFAAGTPFRRANLTDMLDEYLPFGLVAAPLFQT